MIWSAGLAMSMASFDADCTIPAAGDGCTASPNGLRPPGATRTCTSPDFDFSDAMTFIFSPPMTVIAPSFDVTYAAPASGDQSIDEGDLPAARSFTFFNCRTSITDTVPTAVFVTS